MNNIQQTVWKCSVTKRMKQLLLLLFMFPFAVACQQEDTSMADREDGVSLTVRLGSPGGAMVTRGVSDDPRNEQNTWSNWEKLVDGSRFYRVTLLLVDADQTLVGMKDWNDDIKTTLPAAVSTTFSGLKSNKVYKMIAIANYSSITVDGQSWSGLPDFPDLTSLELNTDVSGVIGLLNNYTLPTTALDYLAAKKPQPLSLVQEVVTPTHGEKDITGELIRTYARFRLEIENRSESMDMRISNLSFGGTKSKFGASKEPLIGVDDQSIPQADGNLVVDSENAITPFAYSSAAPLTIPKLDLSDTRNDNSKVAFDTYLYECKNTAGFEYSLNVGYVSEITQIQTVYNKGTGNTTPAGGEDNLYMIGYQKNGTWYYWMANNSGISVTNTDKTEFDAQSDPLLWKISRSGDGYTIQSASEDKYIYIYRYDNMPVVLDNNGDSYIVSEQNIYRQRNKTNYYITINSSNQLVSTTNSGNATKFTFFPITKGEKEIITTDKINKDFTIPLYTLIDGISNKTTIIRRNDFINVLVTVSYNENSGKIDFHVTDWTTGKGEVEFD